MKEAPHATVNAKDGDYDALFGGPINHSSKTTENESLKVLAPKTSGVEEPKRSREHDTKKTRALAVSTSTDNDIKKSRHAQDKTSRAAENLTEGDRNVKKAGTLDVKRTSGTQSKLSRTLEPKRSRDKEVKKSRIVTDSDGRTRRPANITVADDVKKAILHLAIERDTQPWKLVDQALREFLKRESKKESK